MGKSAEFAAVSSLWRVPAGSGTPALRLALRRLFALPESLGVAIAVVSLFSAVVLAIAAVYDAPLSFPRERISIALGFNAVFPVAVAIGLYVCLRLLRRLVVGADDGGPPLVRMMVVDLTLMALFIAATYFHFSLKSWVQVINPSLYDEPYMAVDNALRPVIDLFAWIRQSVFTFVPATDAWYQAAFLLMFISGFCSLAVSRNPVYPRFCLGVLLTMCLGALSYLIAPALGPFIYEEGLNEQATQAQAGMLWAHEQVMRDGMAWIAEAGPAYFSGALAAMPSLHIAHAMVMTWFIIQARSLLILVFLVICFWVVIESVVSRWHYLVDLPAGAILAAFTIWLTHRLCPLPRRRGGRLSLAMQT